MKEVGTSNYDDDFLGAYITLKQLIKIIATTKYYCYFKYKLFFTIMRPQENIVRLIVAKHIDVLEVTRLASGIGVQIDVLDQLNLLDLAMDIIGFPEENILLFDTDIIDNGISTQPNKRQDFENMFDRGKYKDNEWDLSKSDINEFVEKLYYDFDELLLSRPHFFVKKEY